MNSPFLNLLLIVFFSIGFVPNPLASANEGAFKLCENLLRSLSVNTPLDLNKFDELETAYSIVSSTLPNSARLAALRIELDEITDLALTRDQISEDLLTRMTAFMNQLNYEMISPSTAQTQSENSILTIEDLIHEPTLVEDVEYATSDPNLVVIFSSNSVKDSQELPDEILARLMRAIAKGLVGPHAGGGIYRATDVHKNFVEIKYMGKSSYRYVGCIDGRKLKVVKLVNKRNEGRGGSLAEFKFLCRER